MDYAAEAPEERDDHLLFTGREMEWVKFWIEGLVAVAAPTSLGTRWTGVVA